MATTCLKKLDKYARIKIIFLLLGLSYSYILVSQNTIPTGSVVLKKGRTTLSLFLKNISNQTEYRFSYEPSIISSSEEVNIEKNQKLSFNDALNLYLPKNIKYSISGKYVVLHSIKKRVLPLPTDQRLKLTIKKAETDTTKNIKSILTKDSTEYSIYAPKTDSVVSNQLTKKDLSNNKVSSESQKIASEKNNSDSSSLRQFVISIMAKVYKSFEKVDTSVNINSSLSFSGIASINTHFTELNLIASYKTYYTGIGMAYDYYGSYYGGIKIGNMIRYTSNITLGGELSVYSLIGGVSISQHVNAWCMEFTPFIGYTFGWKRFTVFAGPNLTYLNSSYNKDGEHLDLGSILKINTNLGIRYNLQLK
jgi:hypothetical protein